jgi:hypothetical protein
MLPLRYVSVDATDSICSVFWNSFRTPVSDVTLHIVEEVFSTMTWRFVNSEGNRLVGVAPYDLVGVNWNFRGNWRLHDQGRRADGDGMFHRNVGTHIRLQGMMCHRRLSEWLQMREPQVCSLFDSHRLWIRLLELWKSACAVIFDKEFCSEQTHEGVGPSLLEGCLSLPVECTLAKGHTVNHACFQVLPFHFHSTVSRMLNWYNHWRRQPVECPSANR